MEALGNTGRRTLPNWSNVAAQESHVHCLFDGRAGGTTYLALGAERTFRVAHADDETLPAMQAFLDEARGEWVFAALGYDLKNAIEDLHSARVDPLEFPVVSLTVPRVVVRWTDRGAEVLVGEGDPALEAVLAASERQGEQPGEAASPRIAMRPRWDRATYTQRWGRVQRHLKRGDVYEMNLCMAWSGKAEVADPWAVFQRLQERTQAPHAAFVRVEECFAFCGSPERYIERRGDVLRSQPIKGTARRGADAREDADLAHQLQNDPKERAENIMICDLVRNDLSRVAARGTVHVEELCGIHTFDTVHQMISSVACTLRPGVSFTDILRATFPMGSMTGAPKIRAMELIDELEATQRGWYSGAIGYLAPDGDFDLNVVIRTVLYNARTGVVGFEVGGAITAASTADGEYAECLLKAEALLDTLGSDGAR